MCMNKTVIVFDLDDTLFDEREFIMQGFLAVSNFLADRIPQKKGFEELCELFYEKRLLVFDRFLKNHGIYTKSLSYRCVQVYRRAPRKIFLYPEAERCLVRFKKFPLYLVTDGNFLVQERKVTALKIAPFFRKVLYTSRYGLKHAKPSEYCFIKIAGLEQCEPKCVTYVGDNPAKDFVGIKPLGFRTIRTHTGQYGSLHPDQKYDAQIHIKNLDELTQEMLI